MITIISVDGSTSPADTAEDVEIVVEACVHPVVSTTAPPTTAPTTPPPTTTPLPTTTPPCVCSDWSEWSECSHNCGGGMRLRSRECPAHCEIDQTETEQCN